MPGKPLALLFTLTILLVNIRVVAQEQSKFNPADVPATGGNAQAFVPRGWKIDKHAEGDLNSDNVPDKVLQLVPADYQSADVGAGPAGQALIILLSAPGGEFKRAGVATKFLEPEAPQYLIELTVKNGVLSVHQNYGMSEVFDTTHRFRYDAASNRFMLTGFDNNPYHRPQGPEWPLTWTSENYLTGVRITRTDHWLKNGTNKPTEQREQIKRKVIAFEDVE